MKHDYYVSKYSDEVKLVYLNLTQMLRDVQNQLSDSYTFQYKIVGSYSRNMITCDRLSNKGYYFDVNIYPNDKEEEYSLRTSN